MKAASALKSPGDTALELLELGISVIPIAVDGKRPLVRWGGFQKRLPTVEEVEGWWKRWPNANVAIITGELSGLDCLDIDIGAPVGWEGGELPTGCVVRTPRDGRHYWFRHIEGARNSSGRLAVHVDYRGEGGYALAPPSTKGDGRAYVLSLGSFEDALKEEAPGWLIAALERTKESREGGREAPKWSDLMRGVSEGERNDAARRIAGHYIRLGVEADTICVILHDWNGRNNPPWDEREAAQIPVLVANLWRQELLHRDEPASPTANGELRFLKCTDSENAKAMALLYGDRVRYDHRGRRWLILRPGLWWEEDADGEIVRLAQDTARARLRAAADIEDADIRKAVVKWALKCENRPGIDAMLALAKATRPIADAGDGWDSDPRLVGVANGIIDLRSGTLRPGRAEDRVTMHTPVAYDPDARCERWERFLGEVFDGDAEVRHYVWKAVGYSLTGSMVEQVFFLCFGPGANGKSTFLRSLLHVFGPYAHNAAFSAFELHRWSSKAGHSEDLANFEGRRLITASETREGARLDEGRIKALTGGDAITARKAYGHERTFDPVCKVWLGVNHLPKVMDDSVAMWRRVRVIGFPRQFTGASADANLETALRAESEGILRWGVEGALLWQREGLDAPEKVTGAIASYRAENDPIVDFLRSVCVEAPEARVSTGELYAAYLSWCNAEHIPERERLSHAAFGRRIGQRFKRRRGTGGRGTLYQAVGLRAREPGEEG